MVFLLIARCQNGALLQKEVPEACQKYIFPAISERYKFKKNEICPGSVFIKIILYQNERLCGGDNKKEPTDFF